MLAVAIRFDVIWFAHNQVVHGKDPMSAAEMVGSVLRRYDEHQWAWQTHSRDNEDVWKPPDTGHFKVNYDVALSEGLMYMATICRNELGAIIQAKTSITLGSSPIKGEARVARMPCQIAVAVPWQQVIIEGDCLTLIQ